VVQLAYTFRGFLLVEGATVSNSLVAMNAEATFAKSIVLK
jgi:hypothetical protein